LTQYLSFKSNNDPYKSETYKSETMHNHKPRYLLFQGGLKINNTNEI